MSSENKRRDVDLTNLMMADFKVDMPNDDMKEFFVEFHGPNDSLYEGGVWRVRVELPDDYPFKSPSVAFTNRIYHPNIDEMSGAVCVNVLNEEWSSITTLVDVFQNYLPQLLLNPNPSHPLNEDAAYLMQNKLNVYEKFVREHCEEHAKPAEVPTEEKESDDEVSEDERSSADEDKDDQK